MPNGGTVRQNSYGNFPEGQDRNIRINRRAETVVTDFWLQMVLDGRMFHMQVGTENEPVPGTVAIDDELVWMLVDGAAGTVWLPAIVNIEVEGASTSANLASMFEIDNSKVRFTSGGSAFVPANLRTDSPRDSVAATARVGTDITASAKTAVPGSMEIARIAHWETSPTATNEPSDFVSNNRVLFSAQTQPGVALVGVGSMLVHHGGSADVTSYGYMQWAELPNESVV